MAARRGAAVEAGRESGRSGFGALKRRPAHDPATARLPTPASRSPPTHPETPHSYARRPKAAACAADASRSRHPKHRCSGSSRERTTLACGPLPAPVPDSCHLPPPSKPAGGSLLPSPRPLQRGAQQRHHRSLPLSIHWWARTDWLITNEDLIRNLCPRRTGGVLTHRLSFLKMNCDCDCVNT